MHEREANPGHGCPLVLEAGESLGPAHDPSAGSEAGIRTNTLRDTLRLRRYADLRRFQKGGEAAP